MISSLQRFFPDLKFLFALAVMTQWIPLISPPVVIAAAIPPVHTLSVTFDPAGATLSGISKVEFPANAGGSFHLDGLAVTGLWINDKSIDLDNQALEYFADPLHGITIPVTPGPKTVTISYTLDLTKQTSPLGDLISEEGISLTGIWHPSLHQDTIFNLTAEIPANFEAVSEAEEIETIQTDSGKKATFHFPHPLPRLNFIAGPYQVEKTSFGDNQNFYTYFFAEDQDLVAGYRDKTLAYLERYRTMIGPFPYKRFTVIENRLPTGYAMPTFTVLGQSVARLPFITDTSLGHETLHQWFGNSISPSPEKGNWSEGLATFLADMLYREEQGEGVEFRKNQLVRYQSFVHNDNTMSLQQFAGAQSHLLSGQEVPRAIGYTKSAMLFQMLDDLLGREKFLAGLRIFYTRMKHQQAGWEELAAGFEETSGSKLSAFFTQWLSRADVPVLTVRALNVMDDQGHPVLKFTLRQDNGGDNYDLEVPIRVITDGGEIRKVISISEKEKVVEIPLAAKPRELVIDDEYRLMRRLAPSEMPPVWAGFIGSANRLVIVEPARAHIFEPLQKMLEEMGCRIISETDATDKELAGSSLIFLGAGSNTARRIFADPGHPDIGATFEVRKNPLNTGETAVIVSAEDTAEVIKASRKLQHYSKYSFLHFENGRAMEKKITPSELGQRFMIDQPPGGIEISANLSFDAIMDRISDKRVVYIGETHTRVEDHLLQLRIIQAMHRQNPGLAIGMEMFNRPVQNVLDSYVLDHSIDEEEFLRRSHYFSKWSFDYRFYQPIINFARHNRIPVIALNLEKDIVSKVYKETGITGLDEESLQVIPADRDLSMPGYRERISSVFGMHSGHQQKPEQLNNFLQAQSLWDETMAESIATYLTDNPDRRMAVVAGRGHVDKQNAIPPRVERRIPVSQAVVINVEQQEVRATTADFLVFSSPAALPKAAIMGVLLKETENGVMVEKISPHGKAGSSGVKEKDLILKLDDREIATVEDIKVYMFFKKSGESVRAKIKRIKKFWPDPVLEIDIPL
ncbi:MAG: ChaN family lipoprotein [Proteobacteria bacterium]|nr:ChaN family lipoprotein [Pseudomonadota bacterium]MBU1739127.1 ChaN family lipoprotein [Pseudomonadota bacterium]